MLKKIGIAVAALAFAAPALADGWRGHDGRFGHYERFEHRAFVHYRPVYVPPPRVVYGPPVVYAPAPYYYPPRLAIAAPLAPGVSIRLDLPL